MSEKEQAVEVEAEDQPKSCFLISPIGSKGSAEREHYDGVSGILTRLLEGDDWNLTLPDRIDDSGSITSQIIENLVSADLVIANLTFLNPNVMYELAIRHCERKPVVIIAEEGTKIPFDLANQRVAFFRQGLNGANDLSADLPAKMRRASTSESPPDNPVFDSKANFSFAQSDQITEPFKFLAERIERMESKLSDRPVFASNEPVELTMGNDRTVPLPIDVVVKIPTDSYPGFVEILEKHHFSYDYDSFLHYKLVFLKSLNAGELATIQMLVPPDSAVFHRSSRTKSHRRDWFNQVRRSVRLNG